MPGLTNLINKRFTRLVAVKRVENDKLGSSRWLCKCDCGNYKIARGGYLRNGKTKSCGCLQREQSRINGKVCIIHGMRRTSEYGIWIHMNQRCYNFNNKDYKNYGGRGITICDEWRYSFAAFLRDMGKRPGLKYTLERINNDGNYELGNCKWAIMREQSGNTRRNKLFKAISPINRVHISKNQHEFARRFSLSSTCINSCLKGKYKTHKGWTFEYTQVSI